MAERSPGLSPHRRGLLTALGAVSVQLVSPPARAGAPTSWPQGRKAAVSLTYDDGLASQLDNAVPQLAARGLRATFFLTADNARARLADWRAVKAAGNEIADHTLSHPCRLKGYSAQSFSDRELAPMERWLDAEFGPERVRAYAYPCDNTELGAGPRATREARYGALVSQTFELARTTDGPPNDPAFLEARRFFLHGFEPTWRRDDPRETFRYLQTALNRGHWAILIFHEVLPRRLGQGDASLATHARILDRICAEPLWCAPMGEVFSYLGGPRRKAPDGPAPTADNLEGRPGR